MQIALGLSQPSCRFAVSGHGWGPTEVNPAAGGQSSKMMYSHRHLARQLNISAPTDDSPFFFDMKPFRYLFRRTKQDQSGSFGLRPGEFVVVLLLAVAFLSLYSFSCL